MKRNSESVNHRPVVDKREGKDFSQATRTQLIGRIHGLERSRDLLRSALLRIVLDAWPDKKTGEYILQAAAMEQARSALAVVEEGGQ